MEKDTNEAIANFVFYLIKLFVFPFILMALVKGFFNLDWSNKYWYFVLFIYTIGILTKENK
jgi:hypothetical protein